MSMMCLEWIGEGWELRDLGGGEDAGYMRIEICVERLEKCVLKERAQSFS